MKKLLNSGTTECWSSGHGASEHHVLTPGRGAVICARPRGLSAPLTECSIHRGMFWQEDGRVRYGMYGQATNEKLDGVRAIVAEGESAEQVFNFNRPLSTTESLTWHVHAAVHMVFERDLWRYHITLTRKQSCSRVVALSAHFGILPHFATHGAVCLLLSGGRQVIDPESLKAPTEMYFTPDAKGVSLTTSKGTVEFLSCNGFDTFYVKTDPAKGSICLAPVVTRFLNLRPGDATSASATIKYTPRT